MSTRETGYPANPFGGEKCPACGARKTTREDPFCEVCLVLLPPDLRRAATDRNTSYDTLGLILRSIEKFNSKGDGGVSGKSGTDP